MIETRHTKNNPFDHIPWLWEASEEDWKMSNDPIWHRILKAWDLYNNQQFDEALILLEGIETVKAIVLKGNCYLAKGDFERGWPLYERWHDNAGDAFAYKQFMDGKWKGNKVDNLIVWQDQALGDCIQYLRYIPLIKERCPDMRLFVREEMDQIVDDTFPGLLQTTDIQSLNHCPLTSCPSILGGYIPQFPYLKTRTSQSASKIGICWETDTSATNGNQKSIPYGLIKPLIEQIGAISLQKKDLSVNNIADTAAIVNGLDLIISIDTMIAHLAGALGKPTWVMLMKNCDWRWLHNDYIGYPTANLFRQSQRGDWSSVINDIHKNFI